MHRMKLTKLELQILNAFWTLGRASIREIQEAFPEPLPAYTTVETTLYRMEDKQAVRRVRKIGNADIFEPLIARDVARGCLLDEILSYFGGRPQPMLPQFAVAGKLNIEDVRELENMVQEHSKRRADKKRRAK